MFNSPLWGDAVTLFLSLVIQAMPFLLLGIGVSGILSVWVDERWLLGWLPKSPWLAALVGGMLGFLFPVCECGNIPVARRLLIKGVPLPVGIAFLLAAPVFNPVVLIATWVAFPQQPEMVAYRALLSLGIAVLVGWLFRWHPQPQSLFQPGILPSPSPTSLLQGGTFWVGSPSPLTALAVYQRALVEQERQNRSQGQRWLLLLQTWSKEITELGAVLILGAAIATAVQVLMPRQWLQTSGQDSVISVLVMLALAAIVSICASVDAFFALAFASTFTQGSLLAFLVFGPMIDLKAIGLMLTIFRPPAIFALIALTLQLTFTSCLLINIFA
ncbi:MAG: permease [Thermostichales cyanobacterium DRC_bins_46]